MHANRKTQQVLGDRESGNKLNSSCFTSDSSNVLQPWEEVELYCNIKQKQNSATNF